MEFCKQSLNETVQKISLKFKQILNGLNYAMQASSDEIERRIRLRIEEKGTIKRYMLNLRREIGIQVRSMKSNILTEAQRKIVDYDTWLKESQAPKPTTQTPRPTLRFTLCPQNQPRCQSNSIEPNCHLLT